MVKNRDTLFTLACLSLLMHSSCSLHRWWGEAPVSPQTIAQSSSNESACPEVSAIFGPDENESIRTFECYAGQLEKAWDQVEGPAPDEISEKQLKTLLRRGVIETPVGTSTDDFLSRLIVGKKILGFKGNITKKGFQDWLTLAREQRPLFRKLYQTYITEGEAIGYAPVRDALHGVAQALGKMGWTMDSRELGESVVELLGISDSDLRSAAVPTAEAAINVLNMVCPTFSRPDVWETKQMASCLLNALDQFEDGAPWFEFLLNRTYDYSIKQAQLIHRSLSRLSKKIHIWFKSPNLAPIYTDRWIRLAKRMNAEPPASLLDSLKVIRQFGGRSNENEIYPEAVIYLFDIVKDAQMPILEGMLYYVHAAANGQCTEPDVDYWTRCALKNYEKVRYVSPAFDLALQVKNIRYGQHASPLNGYAFSKIQILDQIAKRIIEVFDQEGPNGKPDGLISIDPYNDREELLQLVTVVKNTRSTVVRFLDNIGRKLKHLPIEPDLPTADSTWSDAGFARLLTMTGEILVQRPKSDHDRLTGLIKNVTNLFPSNQKLWLDQKAITTILTTVDSFADYRKAYVTPIVESAMQDQSILSRLTSLVQKSDDGDHLLDRQAVMHALPELLKSEFPRTYESCQAFGFQKSCYRVFDEILPGSKNNTETIHPNDLDIITLFALAMESLVDSCDRETNGGFDNKLSWDLFDGEDELDCGFARSKDVVQRLIDSKILDLSAAESAAANLALELVNSTFITRVLGKVGLIRGKTDYLYLNLFIFWRYDDATIGSIYSFIGDIANPSGTEPQTTPQAR